MVYVIDGVTVSDVDAYNIQDIEEIIIVRNALVNQNGAGNLQLLALVKTKQWAEGVEHITFSAKSAALFRKVITINPRSGVQKEDVFSGNFQQYALTLRGGNQLINFGGSLGFTHDALPRRNRKDSLYDVKMPGINRINLNLWSRLAINKNNTLSVNFNLVPQTGRSIMHEIRRSGIIADDIKGDKEYWVNPYINLETKIKHLSNKFTFSYINGRRLDTSHIQYDHDYLDVSKDTMRAESIQFNDHLSLIKKAGNWEIEPSLNINFQKSFYTERKIQEAGYILNPINSSYSYSTFRTIWKTFTVTPSLSLIYNSVIAFQGGLLLDASKLIDSNYKNTKTYPFVNTTINLTRFFQSEKHFDWKVFGSLSERFSDFDGLFQLRDFNHSFVLPEVIRGNHYAIAFFPQPLPVNRFATQWQAGSRISLFDNRIRLNYNYQFSEQRQYTIVESFFGKLIIYGKYSRKQHHLDIEADILRSDAIRWHVGLYMNRLKDSSIHFDLTENDPLLNYKLRPQTGGLVNRIEYKNFYAGVDMVYLLNFEKRRMDTQGLVVEKYSTLQLSNLFFAYRATGRHFAGEVFIYSRNLVDSEAYPISPDNKKYFGGGVKVIL